MIAALDSLLPVAMPRLNRISPSVLQIHTMVCSTNTKVWWPHILTRAIIYSPQWYWAYRSTGRCLFHPAKVPRALMRRRHYGWCHQCALGSEQRGALIARLTAWPCTRVRSRAEPSRERQRGSRECLA